MSRLILAAFACIVAAPLASAQDYSAGELAERAIHRRAVEAVIWGMPAVNAELMFEAARGAGADFNQVVYWSRPSTWKNQTLTPNPDTIYLMPLYDTKAGPIVLEIPPADDVSSITGSIDNGWQAALEDVGPAGVDKGKGGKYLILPPGYQGEDAGGLHPVAVGHSCRLCAAPLQPQERRRDRHRQGGRLWQAGKALSPLRRRQTRPRRSSSTPSTSSSTAPSPTTPASSSRSTVSSSASRGSSATR